MATLDCGGSAVPLGAEKCTPGGQIACDCPAGGKGVQVCNRDGSGYDACDCHGPGQGGSAGSPGSGGSAGQGGSTVPESPWKSYRAAPPDKIDLLFMIDNSASMADKQEVLAAAVPQLVGRLVSPLCLDTAGNTQPVGSDGKCPNGFRQEFQPVNDIHIGVISSSIGGHGADSCSNTPTSSWNPRQEDMSHLIIRNDPNNPESYESTWAGKGFLFWDTTNPEKYNPPGDKDLNALVQKFQRIVQGTGQDGCGFEASLEAWYRFLVDPAPYVKMIPYSCATNQPQDGGDCRGPDGIDTTVLQQRQDFLRPDSLLAVVMLTDENDCSVIDGWQNFIAVQSYAGTMPWHLPRATSACMSDPGSPQCMSCLQGDHSNDPECQKGGYSDLEDSLNLRCYRQKQRFGIDFLYPIRRYVNGLSKTTFDTKDVEFPVNPGFVANTTLNPLFCPKYKDQDSTQCATVLRARDLVLFEAVVGVPWQDIAYDPADLKKGYRPVEQFGWTKAQFDQSAIPAPGGVDATTTVWDHILGKVNEDSASADYLQIDFSPSGEPKDPLMIESIDQRSGTNPATGAQLAGASANYMANPINGHEWDIWGRNDLQYACTFRLPTPKDCNANSVSCDCGEPDGKNNPLCQADDGSYGTTQWRAKAYPGRRQLAVLHGLDPKQAVAASLCPANMTDPNLADYGYLPAAAALLDRFRSILGGSCWSKAVAYAQDGTVSCTVLEATKIPEGATTCPVCSDMPPRVAPSTAAMAELQQNPDYIANGLQCACQIPQAAAGDPVRQCIESTDEIPTSGGQQVNGWCYVDPAQYGSAANGNLVMSCPADQKRMFRFVGSGHPMQGALAFIKCE